MCVQLYTVIRHVDFHQTISKQLPAVFSHHHYYQEKKRNESTIEQKKVSYLFLLVIYDDSSNEYYQTTYIHTYRLPIFDDTS